MSTILAASASPAAVVGHQGIANDRISCNTAAHGLIPRTPAAHGTAVAERVGLLTSRPGEPGSISGRITPGSSQVRGNRAGRCCWSAGFLGEHARSRQQYGSHSSYLSERPFANQLLVTFMQTGSSTSREPLCSQSFASNEVLGVRVSVARIAPSLHDLGRGVPTGVHPTLNQGPRLARSPPTKANRVQSPAWVTGFSHVGIVPEDAVGRWVFSGISRFPRPFIPALLHTLLITLIGSRDLVVKSLPNL
ncbi:hypothetical protein PR048_002609 [Dryococelus australis]|uniref:Uncharacterized protein n=1 Tax=Dryococelus australis TaxID=614101 RepID=A0ABQ9IN17_9NEOP|nr:hypothetical protein PR048_002609 [Dryococelus australis]